MHALIDKITICGLSNSSSLLPLEPVITRVPLIDYSIKVVEEDSKEVPAYRDVAKTEKC